MTITHAATTCVDAPIRTAEAERRLGRSLPAQLTALLMKTDGMVGEYGTGVVWSLDRILEQNLLFRGPDTFPGLYMPFDPLPS
ncbi:SMI1/KNR4 family protein [Streptomyces sp. NBC_01717]|uniref:SMI1/KNR4 family protein n=1 Tax=Streptomyces sp. NBC_01717 TaxID=2975918 RepID=UPI002E348502|nr:SMI1/KNR4 family protein [Streptomyces sp. NBC_01717]